MDVFSTGPALAAGEDIAGLPDRVTPPDFVVEPQTTSGLRLAEPRGSATVTINRDDEERYGDSSQGADIPF